MQTLRISSTDCSTSLMQEMVITQHGEDLHLLTELGLHLDQAWLEQAQPLLAGKVAERRKDGDLTKQLKTKNFKLFI